MSIFGAANWRPTWAASRASVMSLAACKQRLGRNAADVQAGAAGPFAGVDQRDLHALVGGEKGRGVAAGAAAEDDEVGFFRLRPSGASFSQLGRGLCVRFPGSSYYTGMVGGDGPAGSCVCTGAPPCHNGAGLAHTKSLAGNTFRALRHRAKTHRLPFLLPRVFERPRAPGRGPTGSISAPATCASRRFSARFGRRGRFASANDGRHGVDRRKADHDAPRRSGGAREGRLYRAGRSYWGEIKGGEMCVYRAPVGAMRARPSPRGRLFRPPADVYRRPRSRTSFWNQRKQTDGVPLSHQFRFTPAVPTA